MNCSHPRSAQVHTSHRWCRHLATLGLLTFLLGCSPLGILNALIPVNGLEATRDIAFADHPRLKLDVYRPSGATAQPRTVVVFFYGGGWESGEKDEYLFAAEALVSRGYVVVVPDYRLFPEVKFPLFMADAARAVKWTFDNIGRYGGDPRKVFVMGHSAGAQIAALVAYDQSYLQRVGGDAKAISGVVSLAGPLDFLPLTEPNLFFVFPENLRAASQPINFVRGSEPPTLLLHGEADSRVGLHNTRNLAARLRERGGEVEVTIFPQMSHVGILLAISALLREREPVLDRVAEFIDERAATR